MVEPHPHTTDPDSRVVVFDAGTRLHLALGRPELATRLISSSVPWHVQITGRTIHTPAANGSVAAISIRIAGHGWS